MATKQPQYNYGTGRRKSAVARVFIKPGKGDIVVNDSLRPDQLGCYQPCAPNPLGTRIETPNLDAFARE